jgi:CRISPR-associated protein Csx3
MTTYNIELVDGIIKVGFGDPSSNNQIVKDAVKGIEAIKPDLMGKVAKINGPASLPVGVALGHALAHICPAVAVFDPKLGDGGKYVVAISHDPRFAVGDLID